jgi:hypothetical protein
MYEASIKSADKKKRYLRTITAHENWNFKWRSNRVNMLSIGRRAGYKTNDSQRSPLRRASKELCSPHPGHAIPKCS